MRHTLVRLTGLLVVLMLVLSGCNLIGTDPIMKLDEDFAKLQKQYSGVIASYDGGEITQGEVMANLNSQYNYMSQLYSMYGLSMSEDALTNIEQTVAEDAVRNVAIAKKMDELGLKLDDDKLAELQAEADEHYQDAYDSFYANVTEKNETVRAKQTEYDLAVNGYTKDAFLNMEIASANAEKVEEKVRADITEADVTDEKLQEAYDAKVTEDEESYADDAGSFESAMASEDETVCWMPEGYRTVKHILVIPASDVLAAYTSARSAYDSAQSNLESLREELDALNDDDAEDAEDTEDTEDEVPEDAEAPRTAEEIQADIDAAEAGMDGLKADMDKAASDCLANVQDKLDEINAKLEAGEDFDALIEAYGEDPGMQNEPTKTRGYYVSENSTNWDKSFTAGAMALEKVGDVSETPAVSASGVHIIRYESDVKAGAVALEDVRDALFNETLENMKTEHYNSEEEAWIAALNPVYHIDAFKLSAD